MYINEEIQNDIRESAYKTWPDHFRRTITVPVVAGVHSYDLPKDFGAMVPKSPTSNTNVRRGRNAPNGVAGQKNYVNISGGKLRISPESSLAKIILDYNIPFPDLPAVGNIDDPVITIGAKTWEGLPEGVAEALVLTWAAGADFYIFGDNRKYDRAQTASQKYFAARSTWGASSVGSLS